MSGKTADEMFRDLWLFPKSYDGSTIIYGDPKSGHVSINPTTRRVRYITDGKCGYFTFKEIQAVAKLLEEMEAEHGKAD